MAVEFGIFPVPSAEDADAVVEQVLAAERAGLDLVGIQDHPYQRRFLDTWSLIPFLAARTERIRFFPDVANLPLRPPAVMAKAAATIDLLSGGRFELGLGAGAFWEGIGAMGGPVRERQGVGRRPRGGDPGHPPDVERRALGVVRGRALLARRRAPRARRPRTRSGSGSARTVRA